MKPNSPFQPCWFLLRRFACVMWIVGLVVCLGGCRQEPIVVYNSVPKTRTLATDEAPAVADASQHTARMIVAIAETEAATWFFKLSDSIASIQSLESSWQSFLSSIYFDQAGNPQWQLPSGWQMGPAKPMRFATVLTGPDSSSTEIGISQLPPQQDLLSNVNRWRNAQMGLPPIGPGQLAGALADYKNDKTSFKIFDETGPQLPGGMAAPFANRGSNPQPPPTSDTPSQQPSAQPSATEEASIHYEAPSGWEVGKTTAITRGRWTKTQDQATVELSVLEMNPSLESWRMNIAAWAGQLNIEPAPQVDTLTDEIMVAGRQTKKIRLNSSDGGQTIIAIMVPDEQTGWLIKFAGDSQLVDALSQDLQNFLDSISF